MERSVIDILRAHAKGTLTNADKRYYEEHFMSSEERAIGKPLFEMSESEELEYQALSFNNSIGQLKDYNCPICKNKGEIAEVDGNVCVYKDCDCVRVRRSLANIRSSGLGGLLKTYTFANYKQTSVWQAEAFKKAVKFTATDTAPSFLICGQSGAGKSHLCTAISGELLNKGYELQYMLWIDESTKLKQSSMDGETYAKLIEKLKNVQALYIDDFFKTQKNSTPSTADVRLAFEIINYRYSKYRSDNGTHYKTIISTELTPRQLYDIDAAVAGRILEMCTPEYTIQLYGEDKNYRLTRI